jgi:uncharacterized protein
VSVTVRPSDLHDREPEWADLAQFATRPGPGIQLALVRGPRRTGKSFLLRRLAGTTGGFYHQAIEEDRNQALASMGATFGLHLMLPGGRLTLTDWEDAIQALQNLAPRDEPMLVVLDEFPYLLSHSPELPSVLQRAIDRSKDSRRAARLRIVLCGSAMSAMAGLLTGTKALRGRASLDVPVRPFDHRTAAAYWGIDDPATAFTVDAVLGGTPGYRDLLPAAPPKRPGDVARWLAAGPLNPSSALFREDDYLLSEDPSLPDRALYHSVIAAIAEGNGTQSTIAAALKREQRSVQHPLRSLEEAGFVVRTDDALRSRRPLYRLADPIIRFHHVVTRRDLARFEDRRTREAWADAQPRFATHVLGPHFEELARQFTLRFASASTAGGQPATVAPAVINDATGRVQHEVDVVALGRDGNGSPSVLALGEAKHTRKKRTVDDLERLERVRVLVAVKHPSATSARLLIFSASGFDRRLTDRATARRDVELIDLDRIYRGD